MLAISWQAIWQDISSRPDFWGFISIPLVAAVVTWLHVWCAIKMVLYPVRFIGVETPALAARLGGLHPFGWQGIIPRKARKMSDIVVDRVINRMGKVSDFLREMTPEEIAAHVAASVTANIETYTDEVMQARHPVFWESLPLLVRRRVYQHVRRTLPGIMDSVVQAVIADIDNLVDVKTMCGRQLETHRELVVRIFQEVGDREFRFIVNVSFWIGLAFGVVQMVLFYLLPWHMMLPLYAAVLGLLTNWLALAMVFRPLNPVSLGPFTVQGLFLRRQAQVAEKFAEITSREVLTIERFMREMLQGKDSARARRIIRKEISRLVDDSPALRTGALVTLGPTRLVGLKEAITDKSLDMALMPLSQPAFNRERADQLARLFAGKMKEMTPAQFQDLLRPAFQEDEWILLVLGAVTGLAAGTAQLLLGFA